jgi:SAM-dependent methyltransferase
VDGLGEDATYDVVTSFLVVHELAPALKPAAFAAVARALKPGGYFLIFDEAYPETDEAMQTMPIRFAALAQWYELTWGNVVDNATTLRARCQEAGLELAEETSFSRSPPWWPSGSQGAEGVSGWASRTRWAISARGSWRSMAARRMRV